MTSQEYLQSEIDRQSPKGRLVSKLGFNNFDSTKFEDIYRKAQEKSGSVAKCCWCNEPYLEKSVRQETLLCPACSPGRIRINRYKVLHKVHTLSDTDKVAIANDRTTRNAVNNPK